MVYLVILGPTLNQKLSDDQGYEDLLESCWKSISLNALKTTAREIIDLLF